MSSAKLTLIGFNQYDNTLFDGLDLPEQVNKETLIDTILMNGGEYEVIYSDLDFLKLAIASWSKQWKPTFTEWCRAFSDLQKVAPLENYDRLESWSDSENTSTSESESTSTSESSQGSSSTSGSDSSSGSESMSETNNTYAFDSSTATPKDSGSKSAQSNNTARTYTEQGNRMSSSGTMGKSFNGDVERNFTHGGRIHGNIGVTTSAQMYSEWLTTLQNYGNIYNRIATVFLQNFVIPIL